MPIKKAIDIEEQTVSLTFENGNTLICALADLSPETVVQLALHGLSQKEGDSYAGNKDQAEVLAGNVWDNLTAGNWSVRGEGGPRVTQLVRALVMKLAAAGKEITEADAATKVADFDDDKKKALTAALTAELAEIKAGDAQKAAEAAKKKAAEATPSDLDISALLAGD